MMSDVLTKRIWFFSLAFMLGASLINILFLYGLISDLWVSAGFISVMICSIVMNMHRMRQKKENSKASFKPGGVFMIIAAVMGAVWAVTYGFTLFLK